MIRSAVEALFRIAMTGIVSIIMGVDAVAAPVVPADDAQVVEHLPARLIGMPRLLRDVAGKSVAAPDRSHPDEAAKRARAMLEEARDRGDPRYAGYAMAAIAPWNTDAAAPPPIAILAATIAQYQHDFDGSRRMLEAVLKRDPGNPQATLTLATIARVQGRYADSDAACRMVSIRLYQSACLAENMSLRGQADQGRKLLFELLALPDLQTSSASSVRQWLTTTLAELEERAGHDDAADVAYREALALGRDSYLVLGYVDFLIAHRRFSEAERLLIAEPQPYGDGVLLRLAIVQKEAREPNASASAIELRDRFDAARQRGDAISIHGRELARSLFAVEDDPKGAISVARANLRIQKEPADFLVMAEAARAAKDAATLREVAVEAETIGLVDRRLRVVLDRPDAR